MSAASSAVRRHAVAAAAIVLFAAPARADVPAIGRAEIEAIVPRLETVIEGGMKGFDCPGLAIAIVAGDEVVYIKGFGTRSKGGAPVETDTVFQIGSASKGFLATTMAIAVDRGAFAWDSRVVDLHPDFRMKDPWVTGEMRMFDIIAQRSGLPPYANDLLSMFGPDEANLIRSLRYVDPITSFRSTFAYTNITHLVAGRIVADVQGKADWEAVVHDEILGPLGMANSSMSAAAIEAATNHAEGHGWSPDGTTQVPFTQLFPYAYAGAGAINSTAEDMTRWLRLQIGDGTFEGKTIVSKANLAQTRVARVGMSETFSYAMGWVRQSTPGGLIIWHNGGTPSFGAYVGFVPDRDVGVVVLTNESNVGFPDAVGEWTLDRLLGNPEVDHVAQRLAAAKEGAASDAALWQRPADPRPTPPLPPLAGRYANDAAGAVTVAAEGERLVATFGNGAALTLTPWDGDVFTASLVAEGEFAGMAANAGPLPQAFVQFQIDRTGKLDEMRLTAPDGQSYVFARE